MWFFQVHVLFNVKPKLSGVYCAREMEGGTPAKPAHIVTDALELLSVTQSYSHVTVY